ncbi:MAG: hypothetical protein WA532_13960 [Candidatus Korobacteraceae bacterium]
MSCAISNPGWNMYVFRDGRRTVSGTELVTCLRAALLRWRSATPEDCEDRLLAALIAAGELECALLDGSEGNASLPDISCEIASEITDALAEGLFTKHKDSLSSILQKVEQLRIGDRCEVAVQEGFAYYALHPRKVAMLIEELGYGTRLETCVCVLGIRSIGVTLGAVACAALTLRGIPCRRISVRPTGHPYDRRLEVSPLLRQWIELAGDAEFLIIDEGPGISGSSFLAVAEALEGCGVANSRIHLIGSRAVDPATLRAADASRRWRRYHFHLIQSAPLAPPGAGMDISGGEWRRHFRYPADTMPAAWPSLEPARFLARDEQSIFRFEGFGHYGEAVGARAALLADRGYAPRYLGHRRGFGEYALVPGRTLTLADCSRELLERMASYLALRCTGFASQAEQTPELETMLRWNWLNEFGEELAGAESQMNTERVAICDGRMLPHEWLRTEPGVLLKLDAGTHGDNHFFPGPCDIAWDVAGTIVEWQIGGNARDYFVGEYMRRSGDTIRERLHPYLLAYTTFRMGWSRMAAAAMQGEFDAALLERDYQRYRTQAQFLRLRSGAAQSA